MGVVISVLPTRDRLHFAQGWFPTTAEHYRYCPSRETARTQRFLCSDKAEFRPSVSATHMPADHCRQRRVFRALLLFPSHGFVAGRSSARACSMRALSSACQLGLLPVATHMPAGTSLVNASSHSVHTTGLSPNPPRPRLQSRCDRPASKPDRHRPIRARSNGVGQPWTGGVPVHAPCQLPAQISLLIGNSARASRNSTRLGYQIQPIAC